MLAACILDVQFAATEAAVRFLRNLDSRFREDDVLDAFQVLQTPFFQRHLDDESESFKSVAKGKVEVLAAMDGSVHHS